MSSLRRAPAHVLLSLLLLNHCGLFRIKQCSLNPSCLLDAEFESCSPSWVYSPHRGGGGGGGIDPFGPSDRAPSLLNDRWLTDHTHRPAGTEGTKLTTQPLSLRAAANCGLKGLHFDSQKARTKEMREECITSPTDPSFVLARSASDQNESWGHLP